MCYRQKSRWTKQGMKHEEKECKKDTILATQQCNVSFTSHDLILLSRNTCSELAVSVSHWYVAAEREDEDSCAKHLLSWLLLNNKTLSGILSLKWHRLQIWMWLSWHDKWRGCATIDWIFFFSPYNKVKEKREKLLSITERCSFISNILYLMIHFPVGMEVDSDKHAIKESLWPYFRLMWFNWGTDLRNQDTRSDYKLLSSAWNSNFHMNKCCSMSVASRS